MIHQAIVSLGVAFAIAVICFVPYLIFQYRRYGQFSASRMLWTGALLAYATALVAYTLFPLPSAAWCATSHNLLELDPTVYFRDMWHDHQSGMSWLNVVTSWTVMQMALNVLLFMPLGVILRNLWNVKVVRATLIGLGLSCLIELTQLTGNWFTAPCPYRVADVNDIWTNTLGAFVGAVLALLTPRLAADAGTMLAVRAWAKPVTRGRRLAGMLFDVAALGVTWIGVEVVVAVGYVVIVGNPSGDRTAATAFNNVVSSIGTISCWALILVCALFGSGASLGQRLVYLKPVATRRPQRLWLVVRALVVQGAALALVSWGSGLFGLIGLMWLALAVVWVLFAPRGLSCTLAGCQMVDARPKPK